MKLEIQWPLVLFSLIVGIGASLYAFSVIPIILGAESFEGLFIAIVISMVVMVIGGCCSVFHLARLRNSMHVVTNLFSFSGISMELILLGVSLVLAFVSAFLMQSGPSLLLRIECVAGAVASVLLAFFCGHGYVMPGRPQWDTNLLPFTYLGTSLAGGGFAFCFVMRVLGVEGMLATVGPWLLVAGVVCALSCALYGGRIAKSDEEKTDQACKLLYGGLFACGVAVVLIMALALLFCGIGGLASSALAVVLELIGFAGSLVAGLAVRMLMWVLGSCYLPLFDFSQVGVTK